MKKIYAAAFSLLFVFTANAQGGYNMYYQYTYSPMPMMRNAHGFGMDFFIPVKKSNFNLGLSWSSNTYGTKQDPIVFTAMDGSMINTTVNVTNNFHQLGVYQRYNLGCFSNVLFPFIDSKIGMNFFRTNLTIADPQDTDNCEPLERTTLQRDQNWMAYAGAGVDIKFARFCKLCFPKEGSGMFFNFSFGYAIGGKINYMNVHGEEMISGPHNGTHHHDSEGNSVKSPHYIPFINTQTQVVHEHHVGYVYTAPVSMFQIKAGFSLKF